MFAADERRVSVTQADAAQDQAGGHNRDVIVDDTDVGEAHGQRRGRLPVVLDPKLGSKGPAHTDLVGRVLRFTVALDRLLLSPCATERTDHQAPDPGCSRHSGVHFVSSRLTRLERSQSV